MDRLEDIYHDDQQYVLSDEEVAMIREMEEDAWEDALELIEEEAR